MDDDSYPPDPAVDLLMILIAELVQTGMFDGDNITHIVRRLDLSGHSDLAARVMLLPFSVEEDDPAKIRKGFYVVEPDGGNDR